MNIQPLKDQMLRIQAFLDFHPEAMADQAEFDRWADHPDNAFGRYVLEDDTPILTGGRPWNALLDIMVRKGLVARVCCPDSGIKYQMAENVPV